MLAGTHRGYEEKDEISFWAFIGRSRKKSAPTPGRTLEGLISSHDDLSDIFLSACARVTDPPDTLYRSNRPVHRARSGVYSLFSLNRDFGESK